MTTRTLRAEVPATAAELLAHLERDLEFPGHAEEVIAVSDPGDGSRRWVLAFRGGTATWAQRSRRPDDAPNRIEFMQVEGDFRHLLGSWTATDLPGGGCEVEYRVDYSTSVPHLAGAIDSAVGRVLVRSAHEIIKAARGQVSVTAGGEFVTDPLDAFLPGGAGR